MKKKSVFTFTILFVFILIILMTVHLNKSLILTEYNVISDKLPDSFDGLKIVHLSDLHNETFGENNDELVEMISLCEPDFIVMTGDIIDSRNTDISVATDLVSEIVNIAPVYYVNGNHESRVGEYASLRDEFMSAGASVLENESLKIERKGESITFIGVNDPAFDTGGGFIDDVESAAKMQSVIQNMKNDSEYTVLLSHRPEYFPTYTQSGVDLVFSGHAHGGQFRLPFVGGLVAPGQGFFPEYDSGVFTEDSTSMIVSRGLGNSIIPLRVNNRPEVILVELNSR